MFLGPSIQDHVNIEVILQQFGNASGLTVNFQKSTLYMIRQMLHNNPYGTITSGER